MSSKVNAYTSANASIVGAPGMMYNEATTFNNIHNKYKQNGNIYRLTTRNTNNVHKNKSVLHK